MWLKYDGLFYMLRHPILCSKILFNKRKEFLLKITNPWSCITRPCYHAKHQNVACTTVQPPVMFNRPLADTSVYEMAQWLAICVHGWGFHTTGGPLRIKHGMNFTEIQCHMHQSAVFKRLLASADSN